MKVINGLLKWFASLVFSLAAGLLVIIFLSNNSEISPLVLRLILLASISFIGSLFLRIFFRKGYAFLVLILSLLTSTISVLAIDYFYDTEYLLSFLTKEFQFQVPTLSDIAQIIILLLVSLPVILLFRKKKVKKVVEPRKEIISKPVGQTLSDRAKVLSYQINPKNWSIKLPGKTGAKKQTGNHSTKPSSASAKVHISSSKAQNGKAPSVKATPVKKQSSKKIRLPRFGSNANNNDVKLMGTEEHVCPYCLEEVEKNDSHGVVICPECHTWHHQDCWDITGACGVAHRNKL